jgi:hypothetical protein
MAYTSHKAVTERLVHTLLRPKRDCISYWGLVGHSARMWNGRSRRDANRAKPKKRRVIHAPAPQGKRGPESDRRASDARVQRFSIADIAAGAILGMISLRAR